MKFEPSLEGEHAVNRLEVALKPLPSLSAALIECKISSRVLANNTIEAEVGVIRVARSDGLGEGCQACWE